MSWNNSDSAHEFRRSFPHPTDSLSFMRSSLSERITFGVVESATLRK